MESRKLTRRELFPLTCNQSQGITNGEHGRGTGRRSQSVSTRFDQSSQTNRGIGLGTQCTCVTRGDSDKGLLLTADNWQ